MRTPAWPLLPAAMTQGDVELSSSTPSAPTVEQGSQDAVAAAIVTAAMTATLDAAPASDATVAEGAAPAKDAPPAAAPEYAATVQGGSAKSIDSRKLWGEKGREVSWKAAATYKVPLTNKAGTAPTGEAAAVALELHRCDGPARFEPKFVKGVVARAARLSEPSAAHQ